MGRVQDKVAVITGGAKGLGAEMCRLLAREGAKIAVADIDMDGANAVVAEIEQAGGQAQAFELDVTDEAAWDSVVESIQSALGGFDILVNNAGIGIIGTVEDTSLADWRRTMAVNLDSVFLGTRAAIRMMKPQKSGSIINISSIEGIIGEPVVAAYNASKGGVRIFTKSAALHCAHSGYGIRVNSVHPGFIATDMVKGAAGTLDDPDGFLQEITRRHPIGKLPEPIDVAYAVLYLASDESRHVVGAEMVVDGGYIAQ